jgi:tRNA dimethylallyltransferase
MTFKKEDALTNFLIIILGPTAVGKTSVAVTLAKEFNTEIISADSRQFYKEMQIGTAIPSDEELGTVPHHLIGNLSIHDYYNVFKFEKEALKIASELFQTKNSALLVGGSGLYIDTICNGIDEMPDADPEIREQLNQTFLKEGIIPLRNQLRLLDPLSYERIDVANPKRIIRALEVCLQTGYPYSGFLNSKTLKRPFNILKIGLKRDRNELNAIINSRVDKMMNEGLEEEARRLFRYKGLTALHTVGYRELFSFFEGQYTLAEAVEKIKVNTRCYAKKQMTWFSRDEEIHWFHPDETGKIKDFIKEKMAS